MYEHTYIHTGTTTTTRVNALTFIIHYTTSTARRQIRFAFVDACLHLYVHVRVLLFVCGWLACA